MHTPVLSIILYFIFGLLFDINAIFHYLCVGLFHSISPVFRISKSFRCWLFAQLQLYVCVHDSWHEITVAFLFTIISFYYDDEFVCMRCCCCFFFSSLQKKAHWINRNGSISNARIFFIGGFECQHKKKTKTIVIKFHLIIDFLLLNLYWKPQSSNFVVYKKTISISDEPFVWLFAISQYYRFSIEQSNNTHKNWRKFGNYWHLSFYLQSDIFGCSWCNANQINNKINNKIERELH